jgi:HAD superfamily hydrolase (TIGR01509 family)
MLRAVIFDFNGVLIDDEPLHLELFQRVLREEGISLGREEYFTRYLGLDDRGCFSGAFRDCGRPLDERLLRELIRRKAGYYRETIEARLTVFPGVAKLIPALAAKYPLAIASGALRDEIDMILEKIGLKNCFQAIAAAEDVSEGKPNPEVFLKALALLNFGQSARRIQPADCLAVEDSRDGILAARRAGMKCLAVTHSYPASKFTDVEAVVAGLSEVTLSSLEALFR